MGFIHTHTKQDHTRKRHPTTKAIQDSRNETHAGGDLRNSQKEKERRVHVIHNAPTRVQSKLKYVKGKYLAHAHSFILMLATCNAYRAHRQGFTPPRATFLLFWKGASARPESSTNTAARQPATAEQHGKRSSSNMFSWSLRIKRAAARAPRARPRDRFVMDTI